MMSFDTICSGCQLFLIKTDFIEFKLNGLPVFRYCFECFEEYGGYYIFKNSFNTLNYCILCGNTHSLDRKTIRICVKRHDDPHLEFAAKWAHKDCVFKYFDRRNLLDKMY